MDEKLVIIDHKDGQVYIVNCIPEFYDDNDNFDIRTALEILKRDYDTNIYLVSIDWIVSFGNKFLNIM